MGRFYSNDWEIELPVEDVLAYARKKAEYHAERTAFWQEQEEQHKDGDHGGAFAAAQTYVSKIKDHEGLAYDLATLVRFLGHLPAGEKLKVSLATFEDLGM